MSRNSDSSRFRFRNANDVQNYARQIAQAGRDWAALKYWDFPKLYANGKLDIVVDCSLPGGPGNYDFIFSAIPKRGKGKRVMASYAPTILKNGVFNDDSRFNDGSVFCSVTDFVECPQGRVPSLVRLERHKERFDLLRYMFVSIGLESSLHVSPCVSKREVCFLSSGNSCASRMIQRTPESFDNLDNVPDDGLRHRTERDFVQRVRGFRINLAESSVRIRVEVNCRSSFQFVHLSACPCDSLVSTIELSGHEPEW